MSFSILNLLTSIGNSLTPQALANSSYIFIFLLIFIEGPIVTYIAAFASSLGYLNVYMIFLLSSFAKIILDFALYLIGKFSKGVLIERYFKKRKKKMPALKMVERNLRNNVGKTMAFIKTVPLIPLPGLIMVGAAGVPTGEFLFYSALYSVAFALIFTIAGYYTGQAYLVFMHYFKQVELAILATAILVFVGWLIFRFFEKKIRKRGMSKFKIFKKFFNNGNYKK